MLHDHTYQSKCIFFNSGGSPHNLQSEHSYAAAEGELRPAGSGPAPASQQLATSVWRRRHLISQEKFRGQHLDSGRRKAKGLAEKRFYNSEKEKGRQFSGGPPAGFHEGVDVPTVSPQKKQRGGRGVARVRVEGQSARPAPARAPARQAANEDDDSDSDDEEDHDFNQDSVTDSSLTESDLEVSIGN